MNANNNIIKALAHTIEHGGATVNPFNYQLIEHGEWFIGQGVKHKALSLRLYDHAKAIDLEAIEDLAFDIKSLNAVSLSEALSRTEPPNEMYFLGFYREANSIIIEASKHVVNTQEAIIDGLKNDQSEIFNIRTQTSIDIQKIKYSIKGGTK